MDMRRAFALLAAAAWAACGPAPDASGGAGRDTIAAPAAATRTETPDAVVRWAATVPDSVRRRTGACPFECCVYGHWTGTGEIPLRTAPDRALPVESRIPAGEPFRADSGFVRITGFSILALSDTVRLPATPDGSGAVLVPGDTLVVLDYLGEGHWNLWDGERVLETEGFWGAEVDDPRAELIGGAGYAREWWVYATRASGERGWMDADSAPRVEGADACGA